MSFGDFFMPGTGWLAVILTIPVAILFSASALDYEGSGLSRSKEPVITSSESTAITTEEPKETVSIPMRQSPDFYTIYTIFYPVFYPALRSFFFRIILPSGYVPAEAY